MKKFYLLILCAFKLMSSWAQDYTMDSLKDALSGSTTDISKITALDNLSDFYYNGFAWIDLKKKDTSFRLLNQAIGLAEKNKLTEKEEELLQKLALLYYSSNTNQKGSILPTAAKGLALAKSTNLKAWQPIFEGLAALGYFSTGKRTDSAILLMSQGLDFARKNHMPAEEASLLDYFGTAYSDSYPDSAGLLLRQALSLAEANKLTTQEIDVLRHLANLYGDRKHDSAMMWIHQALSLARQNDLSKTAISIFYSLLGTWSPLYENDSLEVHFNLGSQLAQQIHAQHAEADFLNDYGEVHDKRGNYTKALMAYMNALEIQQQIDDKYGMAAVFYHIGILYLNVQDYAQSLQYLARANEKSMEIKDGFNFVFSLEGIGEDYVNLKKYD
ncbi:MAG TPA: tetratricopeptide repeat protein, partial [Puia sp.]|nr:tetratricopeptide repeat protein [Puia sp.]